MAAGTQRVDFGPEAETNLYLKRAQQMDKSLIIVCTQRINFGLMAVSLRTAILKVVAKY